MFNQGKTLSTIQNIQRFMRWKITFTVISQSILSLRPTDTQNVRTAEALGSAPPAIQLHDQESEMARKEAGKEKDNVCLTAGCIHTASKVLDAMDSTIEPCDDFYNFACGNFVKNTNIPDEKVSVNTFSIIGDLLQEQLRTLVSEETREDEAKPFRLAKNFFKACMNKSMVSIFYRSCGFNKIYNCSTDRGTRTRPALQSHGKIGRLAGGEG